MNDLAALDKCQKQLGQLHDLPSILEIRDKAQAVATYQKTREKGHRLGNQAKRLVAFAEARAGTVIRAMQASGKLHDGKGGKNKKALSIEPIALSELGISLDESSRFQLAAEVLTATPEWFDEYLEECNEKRKDFTQQAVIRAGKELRNAKTGKRKTVTPSGKYDVIVIDPPWPMKKVEREVRPNQSSDLDYPTMTEDDLAELKIPAAEDCHFWLWTTQKFLPMAFRLVPAWGFKYVCTFVWHKPGGFQPIGLPQYNCEFVLYCRKGAPKFKTTKQFSTCFKAPRGKHSEKPQEFYDMVCRVAEGKRLDMFNRRDIAGFKGWGNEA